MIQFSVKWGLPDKLVKPDEHRNTKPVTEWQPKSVAVRGGERALAPMYAFRLQSEF